MIFLWGMALWESAPKKLACVQSISLLRKKRGTLHRPMKRSLNFCDKLSLMTKFILVSLVLCLESGLVQGEHNLKPILLGISSSFFFAFTFVLNRIMSISGGSWVWSSSLRYLFMLPFLILLLSVRRKLRPLFAELISHPWQWMLWSIVGFGVF